MATAPVLILALLVPHGVRPAVSAADEARRFCGVWRPTIVGTEGDDVLRGTSGNDVFWARGGDDHLLGLGGHDTMCGGAGDDVIRGGSGRDWMYPAAGHDRVFGGPNRINVVDYFRSPRGVHVDLAAGEAHGWGRDVVKDVHQVMGSLFADTITGDSGGNALVGSSGDDVLDGVGGGDSLEGYAGDDVLRGGPGSDWVGFMDSPAPVRADLRRRTATGEGDDVLLSIEGLFGSYYDDVLIGDGGDNAFIGGVRGNDRIAGRGGDDIVYRYYGENVVSGGVGNDTVYYEFQGTVDLVTGTAVGTDFSDSISGFENARGGSERQVIVGDDGPNLLAGGGAGDVIEAGRGDDTLGGDGGSDKLAGGDGRDSIRGGRGEDQCLEGEDVAECETATPARTAVARSPRLESFPALRAPRLPDRRSLVYALLRMLGISTHASFAESYSQ
ncbi:MAG TPA: calcium-binding protein [Actinomycetota bacterium]|nr:calcium-binding protein [Actinomycetota bacterium]